MQPKPGSLIKPTLDTRFHIDHEWWERGEEDYRQYLLTHLTPDVREQLARKETYVTFDYIHPLTAEVTQLDELDAALLDASRQPDFINPQTSLIDSVFRVFITNGNHPRTPRELSIETGRNAEIILKTLGGIKVYKGLRPIPTKTES